MGDKITYYLGAGASANSIPIVSKMILRLKDLTKYLESYLYDKVPLRDFSFFPDVIKDNQQIIVDIIRDINWLITESENHQTIDNLAKKFFVQEKRDELIRLKRTLIVYFTLIQGINIPKIPNSINEYPYENPYEKIEKRMDNLIASLIHRVDGKLYINNRVKMISWNYDLQPELVLKNYFDQDNIHDVKEKCQILPNRLMYNDLDSNIKIDINKFTLLKLNGNALFDYHFDNKIPGQTLVFTKNEPLDVLSTFLDEYKEIYKGSSSGTKLLNFAWEEYHDKTLRVVNYKSIMNIALDIASQTQILIIIGYSFPFFNSKIDIEILSRMASLRRIVIQDTNFEEIKSRILEMIPEWRFKLKNNQNFIVEAKVGSYYYIDPST